MTARGYALYSVCPQLSFRYMRVRVLYLPSQLCMYALYDHRTSCRPPRVVWVLLHCTHRRKSHTSHHSPGTGPVTRRREFNGRFYFILV